MFFHFISTIKICGKAAVPYGTVGKPDNENYTSQYSKTNSCPMHDNISIGAASQSSCEHCANDYANNEKNMAPISIHIPNTHSPPFKSGGYFSIDRIYKFS